MLQTFLSTYTENFVTRLITLLVFLGHALLLFFVYFQSFTSSNTIVHPKQKIVIETIYLKPQEINDQKIIQTASPQKQGSSQSTKTVPKTKPAAPSRSPTKPAVTKTPQTSPDAHKQKLLAQARESLQKVESNTLKQADTSNIISSTELKEIGLLQSDKLSIIKSYSSKSREEHYQNEIINRLKTQLQLQEYGNVDIELTLDRNGKCLKLNITNEENHNNRLYIEQTIPNLRFAAFGTSFPGESQHTFVIRISNLM